MHRADEQGKHDPIEIIRAEKYATFLNNLEKWVEAHMAQDNMDEEDVIIRVKESYRRSLQANIDFYDLMARTAKERGQAESAKRCAVMANVYRALIE